MPTPEELEWEAYKQKALGKGYKPPAPAPVTPAAPPPASAAQVQKQLEGADLLRLKGGLKRREQEAGL